MQFQDWLIQDTKEFLKPDSQAYLVRDEILKLLPTRMLASLSTEVTNDPRHFYQQACEVISRKQLQQIYYSSFKLTKEDLSQLSNSELAELYSKPFNRLFAYESLEKFDVLEVQILIYQEEIYAKVLAYDPNREKKKVDKYK